MNNAKTVGVVLFGIKSDARRTAFLAEIIRPGVTAEGSAMGLQTPSFRRRRKVFRLQIRAHKACITDLAGNRNGFRQQ